MQTWRQLELIAINTIYRDELVLGSSFESFKTGIITDSLAVWECEGECDRTFLIRSQVSPAPLQYCDMWSDLALCGLAVSLTINQADRCGVWEVRDGIEIILDCDIDNDIHFLSCFIIYNLWSWVWLKPAIKENIYIQTKYELNARVPVVADVLF